MTDQMTTARTRGQARTPRGALNVSRPRAEPGPPPIRTPIKKGASTPGSALASRPPGCERTGPPPSGIQCGATRLDGIFQRSDAIMRVSGDCRMAAVTLPPIPPCRESGDARSWLDRGPGSLRQFGGRVRQGVRLCWAAFHRCPRLRRSVALGMAAQARGFQRPRECQCRAHLGGSRGCHAIVPANPRDPTYERRGRHASAPVMPHSPVLRPDTQRRDVRGSSTAPGNACEKWQRDSTANAGSGAASAEPLKMLLNNAPVALPRGIEPLFSP
jgi:hypothetical protein